MIRFFTLFFAFTLVFVCNSQEDSIKACALPEKKIQKIINKANEIPVASEKVQLFLEAIEKSPTILILRKYHSILIKFVEVSVT